MLTANLTSNFKWSKIPVLKRKSFFKVFHLIIYVVYFHNQQQSGQYCTLFTFYLLFSGKGHGNGGTSGNGNGGTHL